METRRDFLVSASLMTLAMGPSLALANTGRDWEQVTPDVRRKRLWNAGDKQNARAALLEFTPQFVFSHEHTGHEISYILSGEMIADGKSYLPGDLLPMAPGSCHSGSIGPNGCTIFVFMTETTPAVAQCK